MSRRVLVVEDETPIREMLCFVLEQNGFEPIEAADFAQGVAQVVEPFPDLILLDITMPHMDGYEVCRRLKAAG